MTKERNHTRDIEALRASIVAAAERYRDAMRRYLAEQAAAVKRGAGLDDLVAGNWASFEETARAEQDLFAMLDALDSIQARAVNRGR